MKTAADDTTKTGAPARRGAGEAPWAGRCGFTLAELMIGIVLFATLIGLVMQVLRSGTVQEKQLMEFSGLQREARKAIELMQRDIRGMSKLEVIKRGTQGQLETLVVAVPTSDAPAQEVRYAFNAAARQLTRNGDVLLREAIQDLQVWPFDGSKDVQEILKVEDYKRLAFFKVRLTLARSPGDSGTGQRVFDFLVYPRLLASVRKAKESRLNQADSRFAPQRLEE
ncbi:MAG: prepilin-type N-terminal cleavage/methylation domain-containing protein [Candidatus Wallbacteria bacterium]|nr:prepilin-type N-terminal cleavage/methylation domain-containing protein [Candidatus Wallbacteria bacterium]